MMDWNFKAFTIAGIPVRIHWTLALLVAIQLLRPLIAGDMTWLALAAISMGVLWIHILLHELGHCWGARHVGEEVDQIILWPLGGAAYVGHSGDPRRDSIITVAGPAVNIMLAGLTIAIMLAVGIPWDWSYLNPFGDWTPVGVGFWGWVLVSALRLGLILAAFNLLVPAYPLDGGRLLLNYLKTRYSEGRAMAISAAISIPIGCVLTVWGFLQGDLFLAFIGIMVVMQAYQMKRMAMTDGYGYGGYSDRSYAPQERSEGFFARRKREKRERKAASQAREDSDLRRKVDMLLEKVSREGIGSLTPEERRTLEEASSRMKDR